MKYTQSIEYYTVFDEDKQMWAVHEDDDPDFVVCYATDTTMANLMMDALTLWTTFEDLRKLRAHEFYEWIEEGKKVKEKEEI